MSFVPDPAQIRFYTPGRRPYVEFTLKDQKVHGRVLGWQGEMILVEYPPDLHDKFNHGQRQSIWLHKDLAVRLRREDSLWADLEDDYRWHASQDERIKHRPDPWSIYLQEHPGAR